MGTIFSSLSVRSRYEHFPSIIPFDKQYFTFADNDVLDDKFLQCDVGIYRRRTEKTGTWFWFWSFSEFVYGFFWRTGMCRKKCHHKLKLTAAKVSKSWSLILVCAVFLPRQIITYYNIEDVSDLTKTEVLQRMQTSAVACTTVYQWNKMNTAVWTLIHQTTICSCIILSIDAAWFGSLTIFSVALQAFHKYYQQRGMLMVLHICCGYAKMWPNF